MSTQDNRSVIVTEVGRNDEPIIVKLDEVETYDKFRAFISAVKPDWTESEDYQQVIEIAIHYTSKKTGHNTPASLSPATIQKEPKVSGKTDDDEHDDSPAVPSPETRAGAERQIHARQESWNSVSPTDSLLMDVDTGHNRDTTEDATMKQIAITNKDGNTSSAQTNINNNAAPSAGKRGIYQGRPRLGDVEVTLTITFRRGTVDVFEEWSAVEDNISANADSDGIAALVKVSVVDKIRRTLRLLNDEDRIEWDIYLGGEEILLEPGPVLQQYMTPPQIDRRRMNVRVDVYVKDDQGQRCRFASRVLTPLELPNVNKRPWRIGTYLSNAKSVYARLDSFGRLFISKSTSVNAGNKVALRDAKLLNELNKLIETYGATRLKKGIKHSLIHDPRSVIDHTSSVKKFVEEYNPENRNDDFDCDDEDEDEDEDPPYSSSGSSSSSTLALAVRTRKDNGEEPVISAEQRHPATPESIRSEGMVDQAQRQQDNPSTICQSELPSYALESQRNAQKSTEARMDEETAQNKRPRSPRDTGDATAHSPQQGPIPKMRRIHVNDRPHRGQHIDAHRPAYDQGDRHRETYSGPNALRLAWDAQGVRHREVYGGRYAPRQIWDNRYRQLQPEGESHIQQDSYIGPRNVPPTTQGMQPRQDMHRASLHSSIPTRPRAQIGFRAPTGPRADYQMSTHPERDSRDFFEGQHRGTGAGDDMIAPRRGIPQDVVSFRTPRNPPSNALTDRGAAFGPGCQPEDQMSDIAVIVVFNQISREIFIRGRNYISRPNWRITIRRRGQDTVLDLKHTIREELCKEFSIIEELDMARKQLVRDFDVPLFLGAHRDDPKKMSGDDHAKQLWTFLPHDCQSEERILYARQDIRNCRHRI
ncbi:hypothetical protein M501DRAFT_989641 [Patellaria atrata CBS 101060]|uniref:Uncharacterized protein n=1 Tax=Patellaria atrata CBS 101060 TaxID=1346257 RepID=A0A9P4S1K6_9PEZI|nr:hypothetical protein M501DRAFT_989641 [Patellaria atrata CBS 101060]